MYCDKCGSKSKVIDNVNVIEIGAIYRKRKCNSCGHIFFTVEMAVPRDLEFLETWEKNHRKHIKKKG